MKLSFCACKLRQTGVHLLGEMKDIERTYHGWILEFPRSTGAWNGSRWRRLQMEHGWMCPGVDSQMSLPLMANPVPGTGSSLAVLSWRFARDAGQGPQLHSHLKIPFTSNLNTSSWCRLISWFKETIRLCCAKWGTGIRARKKTFMEALNACRQCSVVLNDLKWLVTSD